MERVNEFYDFIPPTCIHKSSNFPTSFPIFHDNSFFIINFLMSLKCKFVEIFTWFTYFLKVMSKAYMHKVIYVLNNIFQDMASQALVKFLISYIFLN